MSIHPKGNPNKEECLRIIGDIENRIPKRRYARRVQEYLKQKGVDNIPDIYRIQSVRNYRIFDLQIAEALRAITIQDEKKETKERSKTSYE
ncbi:hypothetical protein [Catalinimonas niigatensis]|uniref:hypothetical protein n=1 Tax=Catalinimonas niigatensis TaxID=1397264 RepID=UPI0026655630|nr:hypothetical protein [Catalinimonas niigatensis]WPP49615.1 hypothetical protein PZB72_23355 [Catalinimonas niigatensis]